MTSRTEVRWAPACRPTTWITLALALLACCLLAGTARAKSAEFSDDSRACLKCHEKPDIAPKKLDDGKTLSMHIRGSDYLAAQHVKQDCTDCHSGLDDKTHGKVSTPLASRRALMESMQEACRDCHKKRQKLYDDGLHAALVKGGSVKAPVCANCHDAHYQPSVKLLEPIDKTSCAACHEKVFDAYKADVHGRARVTKGKDSPSCADCHQPHDNKAASLGDGQKDACVKCHKDSADKHEQWLPNTALHFEAISCVVCHSPDAKRRVNLRLYDGATDTQLREKAGVPKFVQRVKAEDVGNVGLTEADLDSLLEQFGRDAGNKGKVFLRGRLEVQTGVEAHQLAPKDKAMKACDTCHRQGAAAFQSVVLSIASADGRPLRHAVQNQVLGSVTAFDSVRGFYALGSTRIKLLDWLLGLAVAGSIAGCLAHWTARRLTRGLRERRAAASTTGRETP